MSKFQRKFAVFPALGWREPRASDKAISGDPCRMLVEVLKDRTQIALQHSTKDLDSTEVSRNLFRSTNENQRMGALTLFCSDPREN